MIRSGWLPENRRVGTLSPPKAHRRGTVSEQKRLQIGEKALYEEEPHPFQFVGSVERIDTPCLAPVLEALLRAFPFNVRGFHTDNDSEFINHKIAARLQALHIDEFTKSRPRRSNDNALVESKNGSVIRKHLGYGHIPSRYAERVNAFTQQVSPPT